MTYSVSVSKQTTCGIRASFITSNRRKIAKKASFEMSEGMVERRDLNSRRADYDFDALTNNAARLRQLGSLPRSTRSSKRIGAWRKCARPTACYRAGARRTCAEKNELGLNLGPPQKGENYPMKSKGNGGAEGDRTPDLVIANDALSQLSYGPVKERCL